MMANPELWIIWISKLFAKFGLTKQITLRFKTIFLLTALTERYIFILRAIITKLK